MIKFLLNMTMFLIMIAIGVVSFMNMQGNKKEVVHEKPTMVAKSVNVISIQKRPFTASITAYGTVQPTVTFQGKAEVAGRVTYVHPALKPGGIIAKGTVVVRINPVDYKLSLDKNRSDLTVSQAQLEQLQQEQASTRASLKLTKANLRLGLQELQRIRTIWKQRLIARSKLDVEQQKVLQLRQKVADTQGKLATYASRIKNANAKIKRSQQQIKGGKTTLGRTKIRMPFDARINIANLDKGEIINAGSVLFEAINTDAVEINAELPIAQMKILLSTSHSTASQLTITNSKKNLQNLPLNAQINVVGSDKNEVWKARVARFSASVDPIRHTTVITVVVDKPNKNSVRGSNSTLLKGMYEAVKLSAPTYNAIVIPRKAIHSGRAFIVNQDKQLEIRPLDIQSQQGNDAIIRNGLKEGEQLIVNDLIPVIKGMPLAPQPVINAIDPSVQGTK
jgi:multidrug efflux pump subunit AcrA (membrane-fusion protein)